MTQPTVSEQLRLLERSLGVELFERTTSGLKLTNAGRDALEHTSAMFLAGERLVRTFGRGEESPELVPRIGVSCSIARNTAADFLMPVLTVEGSRPLIRTGEFSELLRDVRTGGLDLVIGETEPVELLGANLAVELIYRPSLVAIVLPEIDPRPDWRNLSLLEYRSSSVYHWEVNSYLKQHGLCPVIRGEVDDAFLMVEAALRGGFVAFVPKSVARPLLESNRVKVLATIAPEAAGIFAVYPEIEAIHLARKAVALLIENARARLEAT